MVSDDLCAHVFQGMLVEGPSGPEGPTVSQPTSYFYCSESLPSPLPLGFLITAITPCNMC